MRNSHLFTVHSEIKQTYIQKKTKTVQKKK